MLRFLKGVDLEIEREVHAIMGRTNRQINACFYNHGNLHYKYRVTEGEILLDDEDVLAMSVDERSRKGIFLAMQYPYEIPGLQNSDFIRRHVRKARLNQASIFLCENSSGNLKTPSRI